MKHGNLSETLRHMAQDIVGLVQNVELKLHLASMDAKDYWEKLKEELHLLNEKAKELAYDFEQKEGEILIQAHLGVMEMRDRWHHLEDSTREFAQYLKKAEGKGQTQLDWIKLKAALAAMDAKDIKEAKETLASKKENLKLVYKESKQKAEINSHELVEKVRGRVEELKQII